MPLFFFLSIFNPFARAFAPGRINRKANVFNPEIRMQLASYLLYALIEFSEDESGTSLIKSVLIGAIIAVVGALLLLALYKEI